MQRAWLWLGVSDARRASASRLGSFPTPQSGTRLPARSVAESHAAAGSSRPPAQRRRQSQESMSDKTRALRRFSNTSALAAAARCMRPLDDWAEMVVHRERLAPQVGSASAWGRPYPDFLFAVRLVPDTRRGIGSRRVACAATSPRRHGEPRLFLWRCPARPYRPPVLRRRIHLS